ncbi:MAG TPA: neutral/alkaline non-lysosomal ceramidase N-terminal domain-containing protein [Lacipirellula sp.]
MHRSLLAGLVTCCFFIVFLAVGPPDATAAELRAAVAAIEITPPVPWRMSGYFTERVSTGVKDPLRAKAVVMRQGDVSLALVFCDLIGVPRDVSQRARLEASKATGIPAENIAIAATHTHTGPLYFGPLRNYFHDRAVKRLGNDPYETIDYPARLVEQIAAAVSQAHENLRPVKLSAGVVREERLSFNRRFHMKDGGVRFNPGQLNPDIIRPAGPTDPDVGVLSLRDAKGDSPFAAIVAFALHLDTTSGTEYSADYPRFLEEQLQQSLGDDFDVLFGAGTCGDINHIDVRTKSVRSASEIGRMLAETVVKTLSSNALPKVGQPSLAVRWAKVQAPLQQYSLAEVAEARSNIELVGQRKLPFLEEVKACTIVDLQSYDETALPLEVQAFRLSEEVAIVTLPAEIFVELGLAIKAASPFETTIIIELANDCLGYIPTKKAFAEGSYETVNSRVQPGAGEELVKAAVRLLEELK